MSTFLLIPGAGGSAWYWSKVAPLLEAAGHDAVPVQLPADDDEAGLAAYVDASAAALRAARDALGPALGDLIVVGQSLGGFTAPLVAARLGASRLILVNAMTPAPGETGGDWWANTGQPQARADFALEQGRPAANLDPEQDFFHDLPPDALQELLSVPEPAQSGRPMADPWPLAAWPDVPTRFLAGRDDRLFPLAFQRRVVGERLGIEVEPLPGGHLNALSQPAAVAAALIAE